MPGRARETGSLAQIRLDVPTGQRTYLDRYFSTHFRLPIARRVQHHHRYAGCERREKGHDSDDGGQRAPGDRILWARSAPLPAPQRTSAARRVQVVPWLGHASTGSIVDMQSSFMQNQPARVVFVHQGNVVRGDDDGGARLVELDEQPQQPLAEIGIDVAGWLVGEQQLRTRDHGTRDGGALLFAARQNRRQRLHPLAEPDPLQQFDDLGPILGFSLPRTRSGSATFS